MRYVEGHAIVESSLYVITNISVMIGVRETNEGLAIVIRKYDREESLCIHYHRISNLELRTMIRSVYLQIIFYVKYDVEIKVSIQFSMNDGLTLASLLHTYFSSISPISSYYVKENRRENFSALKRKEIANERIWDRVKEQHGLSVSPYKTPPKTAFQSYLQSQPLSSPQKSEQLQTDVARILKSSCFMQRTFNRQQQAIEYIHLYRRFDNDIKLFSYETVSTKQRVFLVLNEAEFKWEYENQRYENNPLQHTYEIILENCPCKLYMDVEFKYANNRGKNGMTLLRLLLRFISYCVFYCFGVAVSPEHFSCIFSENSDKFSCHVLLNRTDFYFRNNIHLKRFMDWAVDSLKASPWNEFSELFVNGEDRKVFIADMAVYTKNRAMRMLMSSKYSEDKRKRPLLAAFQIEEWQHFLPYTLVTEYNFYKKNFHLFYRKGSFQPAKTTSISHGSTRMRSDSFPFSALGEEMLRSWEFVSHIRGGFIRSWTSWRGKMGGWKLRVEIGGNRWCMNKGRAHKSNHIYFVADLAHDCFYQKCHDSDCEKFFSPSFPIPHQEAEYAMLYLDAENLDFDANEAM